jgi:regulator of sigma E protease
MQIVHWFSQNFVGLIWAVVIFALLVSIHEFGHFLVAKLTGVKVLEFSLGFGYRLYGIQIGDTQYSLRILPLGGYVRMLGEGDDSEPNDPGNFQNKGNWAKSGVIAAGPVMNYILAISLLFLMGIFYGISSYVFQVGKVLPGTPAAKAGIKAGDEITAINGHPYQNFQNPEKLIGSVIHVIHHSIGIPLNLTILRNGKTLHLTAVPRYSKKLKNGILGFEIMPAMTFRHATILQALTNSLNSTWFFTKLPFVEIGKVFHGKMKTSTLVKGSAGPIGAFDIILKVYNAHKKNGHSFEYLMWLAAVLNISIGMVNLFPIPALDGSRIFIIGLGALFGKPLDPKLEEKIHLAGFAFLLILFMLLSYQDIHRIFSH